MEIITRAARMHSVARKLLAEERPIGFVPTMGALHEGHLSLVREARRMNDAVVVSIFVSPLRFETREEYERFPHDLARDADTLSPLGVDYIFAPSAEEIFPKGLETYVEVAGLSDKLEGAVRPHLFRGQPTALAILFNLVQPKFVYVGQKDAQQTVIIKKFVRDLHLPVEVVVLPTVREDDGLAMSAQNRLLTPDQRRAAAALHRSLRLAEELFARGERSPGRIIKAVRKEIEKEPPARLEYVAVTDTEHLDPLDDLSDQSALVSLAAYFGQTRLTDNTILCEARFKTSRLKLG